MQKINIGCIGISIEIPEFIHHDSAFNLKYIICERGRVSERLFSYATVRNIPLYEVGNTTELNALILMHKEVAQIVMFGYGKKIKPSTLALIDIYNIHFSYLPFYKGRDPLFWAFYQGEKELGVTLHKVVEGFDEGGIISQRKVDCYYWDSIMGISPKLYREVPAILQDFANYLKSGVQETIPNRPGFYFPPMTEDDLTVKWGKHSSEQIFNLVKARTHKKGAKFIANDGQVFWVKGLLFIKAENEGLEIGTLVLVEERPHLVFNANVSIRLTKYTEG